MGRIEEKELRPFTLTDVANKELIINMLRYEDSIIHGLEGSEIYSNPLNKPRVSLHPEYAIHRLVLQKFNFDTTDDSVQNYRSIFGYYYRSSTDYDKEVLSSVTYMRENKCVYYTDPIIHVGDKIPDCTLFQLDGKKQISLYELLGENFNYAFIGAFSNS